MGQDAVCQKKKNTTPAIPDFKPAIAQSVDNRADQLIKMSDEIWALAEIAFEEIESAKILADYAEKEGFRVSRAVAEMPTAFIAEYGNGRPIIGVLGEYDALPGISQKKQHSKDPLTPGAGGHGCGHNLFGVGSLAAAIAIKDLMKQEKISGTVRFYGTPAEEKYFGKLYMARAGLFEDLDACLDWHPSDEIKAGVQSSLAMVDFIVEFFGQAAHASGDPWNGRSAVDGLELFTTGLNFMREHIKPTVRVHYQIQHGGDVVNVVPDYSRVWVRVRDAKREGMQEVWNWTKEIADGAAKMARVKTKMTLVSGLHEVLVNRTGGAVLQKNLEILGPINYTNEEIAYAKKIQEATGNPQIGLVGSVTALEATKESAEGGSTDVGDVSWLVPEIRLGVTTAAKDAPWHSWATVACTGMSIGHKGMLYAAKALGMTMLDLFQNHRIIEEMKKEFEERKGNYFYKPLLPDGPPPIPSSSSKQ